MYPNYIVVKNVEGEKLEEIILFVFLGVCATEDLLKKQVHLFYIVVFALFGIGIQIYKEAFDLNNIMSAGVLGGLLCVLSRCSGEKVGTGDGAMLITSGIYLGFWKNLIVFWGASAGAALVGMFLYIIMKKPGNYRIPFAPFLLGAYAVVLVMERNGVI